MRVIALALAAAMLFTARAEARVPVSPRFSRALDCGPRGAARINGSLNGTVQPHLRFTRRAGRIRSARAVATLSGAADVRIDASAGAACALEPTAVARWNAPPIRFMAGAIPVLVVPRVTVYVAAEARAVQPVTSRVYGTLRATAGLAYAGRVRRIGSFRSGLVADPVPGRGSAALDAQVIPSIELLLYGQAGP